MNVEVDPDLCCLYAQCVGSAPEIFRVVDGELAYDRHPDDSLGAAAEEAADGCPAGAITVDT